MSRFVVDTNIFISHLLLPHSLPARVVHDIVRNHTILMSEAALWELKTTFARPKFDPYVSVEDRQQFLYQLYKIVEPVVIVQAVKASRDPKDDMILELAVNGRGDAIITGDRDLLSLHPFRKIEILTPADYLARQV